MDWMCRVSVLDLPFASHAYMPSVMTVLLNTVKVSLRIYCIVITLNKRHTYSALILTSSLVSIVTTVTSSSVVPAVTLHAILMKCTDQE